MGSCAEGARGSAADTGAATGDGAAALAVGCVGASGAGAGTTAGVAVGLCNVAEEPDGGGGGAGGGDPLPDDSGGAAGGPADDGSGTGVLAAITQGARGNLPLTGLPVWIVFLAGMALLGLGKVLYRRRTHDAVDLLVH